MEVTDGATSARKPLWRRIVDFPLVAMVVSLASVMLGIAGAVSLAKSLQLQDQLSRNLVLAVASTIAAFVIYKFVICRLGEAPRDELGLAAAPRELSIGLVAGFVLFALVVAVAAAVDVYNIAGPGGTRDLLRVLVTVALAPAVIEEIVFRGILFRWVEDFAGSWAALLLTSALFGLVHIYNPNATWFSSFAIAVEAGLLLGGAYMLTRSLWAPIGLHFAWNFTQGFVFDVPVSGTDQIGLVDARLSGPELLSGGGFGLEASVIALTIATAAGRSLVVLAVRRGRLVQPWWMRRGHPAAD
jgi:membrane protease YdiL (CAAX protease family)